MVVLVVVVVLVIVVVLVVVVLEVAAMAATSGGLSPAARPHPAATTATRPSTTRLRFNRCTPVR